MDETVANYLAANPAAGGDVKTLNVPSMRNLSCTTECTWQRTVRNTLDTPSDWTVTTASTNPDLDIQVSPSNFSFDGDTGETQTLTITAAPQADLTSTIAFGEVVMTEDAGQAPEAHPEQRTARYQQHRRPGSGLVDRVQPARCFGSRRRHRFLGSAHGRNERHRLRCA